jgi:cytoplasmic iron level regulating protein YaaA (DUF328/UPF0246 family)
MGAALANPLGKDLYAFWGDTLAAHLNARQADEAAPVIVNLASVEYAKAAMRPVLRARVVDCVFEEAGQSGYRIVSFFAKQARGRMARFAVQQRVRSVRQLEAFAEDGYAFDRAASTRDRLVYRRGG